METTPTTEFSIKCPSCGNESEIDAETIRSLNGRLNRSLVRKPSGGRQGKPKAKLCKRGHELTEENRYPSGACRLCAAIRAASKKAATIEQG